MPDREKVIKGLELCEFGSDRQCYEDECPYYQKECTEGLLADILTMMKAQEPVEPHIKTSKSGTSWWYSCGNCNRAIDPNDKYCRNCGRAVKWNE